MRTTARTHAQEPLESPQRHSPKTTRHGPAGGPPHGRSTQGIAPQVEILSADHRPASVGFLYLHDLEVRQVSLRSDKSNYMHAPTKLLAAQPRPKTLY